MTSLPLRPPRGRLLQGPWKKVPLPEFIDNMERQPEKDKEEEQLLAAAKFLHGIQESTPGHGE